MLDDLYDNRAGVVAKGGDFGDEPDSWSQGSDDYCNVMPSEEVESENAYFAASDRAAYYKARPGRASGADYREATNGSGNYAAMSTAWGSDEDEPMYGIATGLEKKSSFKSSSSSIDVDGESDFDNFVLPVVSPTPALTLRRETQWNMHQPHYDVGSEEQPLYDAANNADINQQPLYDITDAVDDDTVVVYDHATETTPTAMPDEDFYDSATANDAMVMRFDMDLARMGSRAESHHDSPIKSPRREGMAMQLPGAPDEDEDAEAFYDSATGPSAIASTDITDVMYDSASRSPSKWGKNNKKPSKASLPVPPPRSLHRGNSMA